MIDVVHLRGVARAAVLDVGDESVPIPAVDRPARKPHANLSRATVRTGAETSLSRRLVRAHGRPTLWRQQTPRGEEEAVGRRKGCELLRSPAGVEEKIARGVRPTTETVLRRISIRSKAGGKQRYKGVPFLNTPASRQTRTYTELIRAVEWSRKARILQSPTVVQLLTRVRDG